MTLYAHRAVHWPASGTLIIADTHFGKDATFRASGIALPHGTTGADLARLDALLAAARPDRLLILGDFFHASRGRSSDVLDALADWRSTHAGLTIVNVRGNHDLRAGDPPAEWDIESVEEPLLEPPFAWQHHPQNVDGYFAMGGHLHPGVALEGPDGSRIKAACFWFRQRSAVLPAFSDFTGIARMQPRVGDAVFVVDDGEIARVA